MDTFPSVFAVWRPSLGRWQMCKSVRDSNGRVRRFTVAWGAYTSVQHCHQRSGPAKESVGIVDGQHVRFRRVPEYFLVSELVEQNDRMSVIERRVPVLDFVCWRRLPRTCV